MLQTKIPPAVANGVLPVKLGFHGAWFQFEIVGGPYDKYQAFASRRENAFGVCVRAERVPENVDLVLPIHDFSVPHVSQTRDVNDILRRAIAAALDGKQVWVGCAGGWGRTGLFLSLLAKACGVEDPIGYVREHYTPRAVETEEQEDYVSSFDVDALRAWLFWRTWNKRVFWWL